MKHDVDLDELARLYTVERLTSRQIGVLVGVPYKTVLRYLQKAGVELRNPGDPIIEQLADKAWLERRYVTENQSTTQIAAELGCEPKSVSLWLSRHGIKARSAGSEKGHSRTTDDSRRKQSEARRGRKLGSDNPNWKGGRNTIDPARNRTAALEWVKAIKDRDGWQCVKCDATGCELHAHHIKSWRHHPELRYDLSNGVTLCRSCHEAEHGRRFKFQVSRKPHERAAAEM